MLVLVGLTHQQTPLHVRERSSVAPEGRGRVLSVLGRRFGHAVLLSTCGRVELYIDHPNPLEAERAATAWLGRLAGLGAGDCQRYIMSARGDAALRHAMRVACGLESAIEGEDEILGQVRRAWLDAGHAGTLSPGLDAAFRLAVRTGRQARRIGDPHAWMSMADTAAARVLQAVHGLPAPRVLIAGSGPMGVRAADRLRARLGDALDLSLAGRTPERVAGHAARLGARPLPLDGIPAALVWADAAVVGLRTGRAVIGAADIAARPAEHPLFLVDLSVPRAVEQSAAALPGVRLCNVDDLTLGGDIRARWDTEARGHVERLVEQAVADFAALTERSDAAVTLTDLRIRADGIRRAQLARTLRRLPHLDDEARWTIEALTHAIVNKLLHEPTARLKDDRDGAIARQVRELFGMATEEDPYVTVENS